MATDVMLNVRLDKTLKEHGAQVLERNGLSTTALIRNLFEYMEANQEVPGEIVGGASSRVQARRKALRAAVGACPVGAGFNYEEAMAGYHEYQAGKFVAGVRE